MIGQAIEGYRVHKQLGPLPLGSRFEAHHPERGAAVLYVLDGAPPLGQVAARRLCGLQHRNLCRVLHVGQIGPGDGPPYLIEEQVAGEALRDRVLRRGPLLPKEALWALGQVVAGLSALHQAGFAHRNLSISSLVVAPDGDGKGGDERVVLVDVLAVPDVPGRDIAEDLQRLGGIFLKLLGHGVPGYVGPASVTMQVLQDLRRALEAEGPGPGRSPRSALEIYAGVEAAVQRCGLTTAEESALLSDLNGLMALTQQMPSTPAVSPRPSGPGGLRSLPPRTPAVPSQGVAPVAIDNRGASRFAIEREEAKDSATIALTRADLSHQSGEEEPATIEMERMDPAELLSFLPAAAAGLAHVKGPLEGRADLPGADSKESGPDSETQPAERADPGALETKSQTQQRTKQTGRLWQRLVSGPLMWLLPLGLCTAITLMLAAWALMHPHQR